MDKQRTIQVKALWDHEAQVWVATSEDVPGLATEADTMEQLLVKLQTVIPELLHANGLIPDNADFNIPLHLLSERTETIRLGE